MDRVGIVFLALLRDRRRAVVARQAARAPALRVELKNIDYSTSTGFNVAAVIVAAILVALYAIWW